MYWCPIVVHRVIPSDVSASAIVLTPCRSARQGKVYTIAIYSERKKRSHWHCLARWAPTDRHYNVLDRSSGTNSCGNIFPLHGSQRSQDNQEQRGLCADCGMSRLNFTPDLNVFSSASNWARLQRPMKFQGDRFVTNHHMFCAISRLRMVMHMHCSI